MPHASVIGPSGLLRRHGGERHTAGTSEGPVLHGLAERPLKSIRPILVQIEAWRTLLPEKWVSQVIVDNYLMDLQARSRQSTDIPLIR
jgi:hypothetical protein